MENILIEIIKNNDRYKKFDDSNEEQVPFDKYKYNSLKSNDEKLVFTYFQLTKVLKKIYFGLGIKMVGLFLFLFLLSLVIPGDFDSPILISIMIVWILSLLFLIIKIIITPFLFNRDYIIDFEKKSIWNSDIFRSKTHLFNNNDFENVYLKKDKKNHYFTFRGGKTNKIQVNSIIIKIPNEEINSINKMIEVLSKFSGKEIIHY
jgi:hypothetical protein